ncbi:hypothetical protein BTVI_43783 [Pitangus sulphuratus]|nr:hypothetical protein BTVI_43783 [Pitangus sulphuratus]
MLVQLIRDPRDSRLWKNCGLRDGSTPEKSIENCLLWEGTPQETGEGLKAITPCNCGDDYGEASCPPAAYGDHQSAERKTSVLDKRVTPQDSELGRVTV